MCTLNCACNIKDKAWFKNVELFKKNPTFIFSQYTVHTVEPMYACGNRNTLR